MPKDFATYFDGFNSYPGNSRLSNEFLTHTIKLSLGLLWRDMSRNDANRQNNENNNSPPKITNPCREKGQGDLANITKIATTSFPGLFSAEERKGPSSPRRRKALGTRLKLRKKVKIAKMTRKKIRANVKNLWRKKISTK